MYCSYYKLIYILLFFEFIVAFDIVYRFILFYSNMTWSYLYIQRLLKFLIILENIYCYRRLKYSFIHFFVM